MRNKRFDFKGISFAGVEKYEGEVEKEEQNVEVQAPVLERCLRLRTPAEALQSCRCLEIWKNWVCPFLKRKMRVHEHLQLL